MSNYQKRSVKTDEKLSVFSESLLEDVAKNESLSNESKGSLVEETGSYTSPIDYKEVINDSLID